MQGAKAPRVRARATVRVKVHDVGAKAPRATARAAVRVRRWRRTR